MGIVSQLQPRLNSIPSTSATLVLWKKLPKKSLWQRMPGLMKTSNINRVKLPWYRCPSVFTQRPCEIDTVQPLQARIWRMLVDRSVFESYSVGWVRSYQKYGNRNILWFCFHLIAVYIIWHMRYDIGLLDDEKQESKVSGYSLWLICNFVSLDNNWSILLILNMKNKQLTQLVSVGAANNKLQSLRKI